MVSYKCNGLAKLLRDLLRHSLHDTEGFEEQLFLLDAVLGHRN